MIRSGDVELFHRRFGLPGAHPLLILHGANYYDSADWIAVAGALAGDREVVSYDARGYGASTWSESANYSLDAQLADIVVMLDHLGWQRAVLVGHSRGGSFALRFAHEFPERVAGLVLVDFSPGHTPGRSGMAPLRVGPAGPEFATLEEAAAATSRDPGEIDRPDGRARLETIFGQRDGVWVNVQRDPAFQNDRPLDRPDWVSAYGPVDLWDALSALRAPALVVRGTRSAVYDEAALRRVRSLAHVGLVEVDAGHDVPGMAPTELVESIGAFLRVSEADQLSVAR